MTLSGHQGHVNLNQTLEFNCVWHHTKFETNRFTSVLTHDDIKSVFHTIASTEFSSLNISCGGKIGINFNKPTGHGNILNFIHIDVCICEKKDIGVFDFSYNCDLE